MDISLKRIQREEHPHCLLCGRGNKRGLKLDFQIMKDGSLESSLKCSKALEGYKNIVHGGVTSALLDSIMTNCLFAHGIKAVTAELKVRFLHPVDIRKSIRLRARIEKTYAHFYALKAELYQDEGIKARATGKFMRLSQGAL
jgi:uncharacterized protein (TIGR00369 family)